MYVCMQLRTSTIIWSSLHYLSVWKPVILKLYIQSIFRWKYSVYCTHQMCSIK